MTLCWEVLQTTDRHAAFSIKYLRNSPVIADRTSVHGLGHYPAQMWQPGDIFCDAVRARNDPDDAEKEPPNPAYVYDMLLVLLDADTMDVNWLATTPDGTTLEFPVIGQVISPAGDMSSSLSSEMTRAGIAFHGLANLHSYALRGRSMINLSLLWDVTDQPAEDWSQFIHLIGPDTALVLADGTPRQGNYPTWAWTAGERIVDHWLLNLPEVLPAGDYTLRIGFYRKDNGERIPTTEGDGATLATFHID